MTHPVLALRAAMHARLTADAPLLALLGGPWVWDEPPRGSEPPYVTFGDASAKDWSTGGSAGHLQSASLVAWSNQGGDAQGLGVLDRIEASLTEAPLVMDGHVLVLLRVLAHEAPRPDKTGLRKAVLRIAALTERV